MMLPLVFIMSLLSPVGKCADLSGRFVHAGEDGGLYVSIIQTGCERIAITWDGSLPPSRVPFRLVLDDRFHPTNPNWSGFRQLSSSLRDATLSIRMVGQSPGDTAHPHTLHLTLLTDGDLCVTDDTTSWGQPPFRLSRYHGENRDDAARRSEQGCSVE
jgi:hypothetical protein